LLLACTVAHIIGIIRLRQTIQQYSSFNNRYTTDFIGSLGTRNYNSSLRFDWTNVPPMTPLGMTFEAVQSRCLNASYIEEHGPLEVYQEVDMRPSGMGSVSLDSIISLYILIFESLVLLNLTQYFYLLVVSFIPILLCDCKVAPRLDGVIMSCFYKQQNFVDITRRDEASLVKITWLWNDQTLCPVEMIRKLQSTNDTKRPNEPSPLWCYFDHHESGLSCPPGTIAWETSETSTRIV
jgi:hypothetical protein